MAAPESKSIKKSGKTDTKPQKPRQKTQSETSGVAGLQQSVGNRAVQRLLAQRRDTDQQTENPKVSRRVQTEIEQKRGHGQSLDSGTQAQMTDALGQDFGGVQVHTDAESHQLNDALQARAFTTGQDIFFRQGEYNPHSTAGQELLAHELTHVVQQQHGEVDLGEGMRVNEPDDSYEKEADSVAGDVVSERGDVTAASTAGRMGPSSVQRQDVDDLMEKPLQRQDEMDEEELMAKPVQRVELDEEELMAKPIQRQDEMDEEELMAKPIQRQDEMEEEELMAKPIQRQDEMDEEELMAKPIQRQDEMDEEELMAKPIQRQDEMDEEELMAKPIQRQDEMDEEELMAKPIQRQDEMEEEELMAQPVQREEDVEEELLQKPLQRQEDSPGKAGGKNK